MRAKRQGLLFIETPSCSHPVSETEEDGQSRLSIYSCVNYVVDKDLGDGLYYFCYITNGKPSNILPQMQTYITLLGTVVLSPDI